MQAADNSLASRQRIPLRLEAMSEVRELLTSCTEKPRLRFPTRCRSGGRVRRARTLHLASLLSWRRNQIIESNHHRRVVCAHTKRGSDTGPIVCLNQSSWQFSQSTGASSQPRLKATSRSSSLLPTQALAEQSLGLTVGVGMFYRVLQPRDNGLIVYALMRVMSMAPSTWLTPFLQYATVVSRVSVVPN